MPYIVMTASAKMPASCKDRYRRVAVCEVQDSANQPKMISNRARGMVRIVETWERRFAGLTDRCAYRVALREAENMARTLSGGAPF